MPRHRVGVAVLLNASGPAADVADLVATYAYDVVLGRAGAEARADSLLDSAATALDAAADFYTRPEAVRLEFGPGRGEVVQFFVSPHGADSLEYAGYVFRRAPIRRSAAPAPSRSPAASSAGMPRARR